MCTLNHPNILRVFGVVPERGWIIMELCGSGSLVRARGTYAVYAVYVCMYVCMYPRHLACQMDRCVCHR